MTPWEIPPRNIPAKKFANMTKRDVARCQDDNFALLWPEPNSYQRSNQQGESPDGPLTFQGE